MTATLRPLGEGDAAECEDILRSLPDWFGIEESIVQFVRDLGVMETWVAVSAGRTVGFMTLVRHDPGALEIHVMAVRAEWQGRGVGRALVRRAEDSCRQQQVPLLCVKTLGPSRTCEHYERTRRFYLSAGFHPLEENDAWGAANPCLVLVKPVAPAVQPLQLEMVPGVLAVARLPAGCAAPPWTLTGPLSSITRTSDETSVICAADAVPTGVRHQSGYRAMRVRGRLEFDQVGVLASLVAPLARAGLSILAFSTHDTDYLLVAEGDLARARAVLTSAGHAFRGD